MKTTQEQRRNLRLTAGAAAASGSTLLAPNVLAVLDDLDELQAENEQLRERLHKADGMANEINLLVAENRKLQAEVEQLTRQANAQLADADIWEAVGKLYDSFYRPHGDYIPELENLMDIWNKMLG